MGQEFSKQLLDEASGKQMSPEELSKVLLKELSKQDAEIKRAAEYMESEFVPIEQKYKGVLYKPEHVIQDVLKTMLHCKGDVKAAAGLYLKGLCCNNIQSLINKTTVLSPGDQLVFDTDFDSDTLKVTKLENGEELTQVFYDAQQKRVKAAKQTSYNPDGTVDSEVQRVYYESGQIKTEIFLKGLHRHGVSTSWYPNGKKRIQNTYKDNQKHGDCFGWNQNGIKTLQTSNQNGVQHGTKTMWSDNGTLIMVSNMEHGVMHGETIHCNSEGIVRSRLNFVRGIQEGVQRQYNDKGQLVLEFECSGGQQL